MGKDELLDIISCGETSMVKFKERMPNKDSLAQEMIAFSNTMGGLIIVGVNDKTGNLNWLTFQEIELTNRLFVDVASGKIFPPIFIQTETACIDEHKLILITVPEGLDKPYKTSSGAIYMKNGADKRVLTSNNEIARLLQSGKNLFADELPVEGSLISDVDLSQFEPFITKKYKQTIEELNISLSQLLENQGLLKSGQLSLAGLLLFGKNRHKLRPMFSIQCVSVDDRVIIGNLFLDNELAFEGTIAEVFEKAMGFIDRNMRKIPSGKSFNSLPIWQIPYGVFEELIINALIHRDYFIPSTIKIFIFADRIEIISPGKLPNSLTVENIENGISIARNPILQSIAQFVLPYKGLGTGIARAKSLYQGISFENLTSSGQFKAIIAKPKNSLHD